MLANVQNFLFWIFNCRLVIMLFDIVKEITIVSNILTILRLL